MEVIYWVQFIRVFWSIPTSHPCNQLKMFEILFINYSNHVGVKHNSQKKIKKYATVEWCPIFGVAIIPFSYKELLK